MKQNLKNVSQKFYIISLDPELRTVLMSLVFSITLSLCKCVLITLMLANMFVLVVIELVNSCNALYHILLSIVHTFLHWKLCWNIPVHYTLKVAEKGFKMALWWLNLQWLILVKLFLKNLKNWPKIIVKFRCALYLYADYSR